MSDVDPTPETPTTIGDRLGWFRGDMAARLDLVVARLDLVVARLDSLIAGGNLDSAPIVAAIGAMQGTAPNNTLAALYTFLSAEIGSGEGISLYNVIDAMHTLLTATNNAIGGVPNNSLELATVRGLLSSILYKTAYGILPDTNAGETPTQAIGTVTDSGFRWLIWSSIQDATVSEDGIQLTPDDNWTGYAVYVQTDAPEYEIFDFGTETAAVFTSNSWHTLDTEADNVIGIRVAANYAATGYMRVPEGGATIYTLQFTLIAGWWSATFTADWPFGKRDNPTSAVGAIPNGATVTFVGTGNLLVERWNLPSYDGYTAAGTIDSNVPTEIEGSYGWAFSRLGGANPGTLDISIQ